MLRIAAKLFLVSLLVVTLGSCQDSSILPSAPEPPEQESGDPTESGADFLIADAAARVPVVTTAGSAGLLISPTGLDFGEVTVGVTSPQQTVDITNVGSSPVVMSGAGGAPGGDFGAGQTCQGTTLNPGESCQMFVTYTPTTTGPATGTSAGTWNDQSYSIALQGTGVVLVIEVDIDVNPGSESNPINLKSKGVVPVAIMGNNLFDVTDVDVTTLVFGPAGAAPLHDLTDPVTYANHLKDMDIDGFPDLVMGQGVIHPNDTGTWLNRILDMAWSAQEEDSFSITEKSQLLAFAYGFLVHAGGDLWAHTLVNEFSEGPFPEIPGILSETRAAAKRTRRFCPPDRVS